MVSTKHSWGLMGEHAISEQDRDVMVDFINTADRFTQGEKIKEFEQRWAQKYGYEYAVFVNSGSSANLILVDAIKHLTGATSGICQAITWATNVSPFIQLRLNSQLCDISLENFGPDISLLKRYLEEPLFYNRPRILFLTHLLGYSCWTPELEKLVTEKDNLIVIEDGCESVGTLDFEGKPIGNRECSYGITYSFYYGHHMTTMEGGMVCTNRKDVYEMCLLLRSHGMVRELPEDSEIRKQSNIKYSHVDEKFRFIVPGYNVRGTEISAVLGIEQLHRIDSVIKARRDNANAFFNKLNPTKYITRFHTEAKELSSSFCLPIIKTSNHLTEMDDIKKLLEDMGIEYRPIIGSNMYHQPMMSRVNQYRSDDMADYVHHNGIYVGNHPEVNPEDCIRLAEKLNEL